MFNRKARGSSDPVQAFSAAQLVNILGCSISTARRYHAGQSVPRPAEIRLLGLLSKGRVMPDEWPGYMRFEGSHLSTHEGLNSWSHVEQAKWLMAQWYHTSDFLIKVERQLSTVSSILSLRELAEVNPIHSEIKAKVEENLLPRLGVIKGASGWHRKSGC